MAPTMDDDPSTIHYNGVSIQYHASSTCPTCGGPVRRCDKCGHVEHEPQHLWPYWVQVPSVWEPYRVGDFWPQPTWVSITTSAKSTDDVAWVKAN